MSSEAVEVFFSYNSKDRDAVRRVADEFRLQGVRVWMDEDDLPFGQPWQPNVETALQEVHAAAILLGPSGFGDWQKEEARLCLTQGVKRHIPVIPILLPGGPPPEALPDFLRERNCSDLRNDRDGGRLQRLIREIRGTRSETIPPTVETVKSGRPPQGPKIHNLPYLPLGEFLIGRDDDFSTLETNLQGHSAATAITQAQAIHGLGGIGKTRLAVEYAWRSAARFDAALFVVADSPVALRAGLAGLARLGLKGVLAWLRNNHRWLLILDNVDTEDAARAVRSVLPRLGNGHVVITSRWQDWPSAIQRQSLDTLSVEEATQFLFQRSDRGQTKSLKASTREDGSKNFVLQEEIRITSGKREGKPSLKKVQSLLQERTEAKRSSEGDNSPHARRLALLLDCLPLALELAAAYIDYHRTNFADYIAAWEGERDQILAGNNPSSVQYPLALAVTWQRSFKLLRPTAATILRLTAYLAVDPIPVDIFEKSAAFIQESVSLFCQESGREVEYPNIREGLAELAAHSLITRCDEAFIVHPMIQEIVRSQIPKRHSREWVEKSLRLIDEASPQQAEDFSTWHVWDSLQSHARVVVANADHFKILHPTGRLMAQVALLLNAKGFYSDAEPLMKKALEVDKKSFGPNHPNVAKDLNNFAELLRATDRFAEAEPLLRRALKIEKNCHGGDHPDVAIRLNNLAQLLRATNRFAEAEPLMLRALKIDEDTYGDRHPNVAIRLNNLAELLLQAKNRLTEAEQLMHRALEIDQEELGQEHPAVATDLITLGKIFQARGLVPLAEQLVRRALKIDEDFFGQDHANVARDLNNLAQLLQAKERMAEAEPLMRRALRIDEASLGENHSEIAIRLTNLATLLQATNRLAESEPLMRRALKIDEDLFGPNHPNVARDLNNLALLLRDTDRLTEAEALFRQALKIGEDSFGHDHPSIAIRLINLGLVLRATGRVAEAEPLMRRALKIDEASFGPEHPEVAKDIFYLAWLLRATNQLADAEPLMRRALKIFDASFGPNHSDTQDTMKRLKIIEEELGSRGTPHREPRRSEASRASRRRSGVGPDRPYRR